MTQKLHNNTRAAFSKRSKLFLFWLCCALLSACLGCCITLQSAEAKSYTLPQTIINAQIDNAGALHVQEARSFNFDGEYSLAFFKMDPPKGSHIKVEAVSIMEGMPAQQELAEDLQAQKHLGQSLEEQSFRPQWRTSGGPNKPSFSFDEEENTLYAFLGTQNTPVTGTYTVVVRYNINAAVELFSDAAQFYWQYVPAGWEESSANVFAQISLPCKGVYNPEDKLVRVWGHGSLDSSWQFDAQGRIVLKNPRVNSGNFAEVRILFPLDWISHKDGLVQKSSPIVESALEEEGALVQQANEQRMQLQIIFIGGIVVLLLLLCLGIYLFMRARKELRPQFQEKYWRDVPDKQAPATCIARLLRGNDETSEDLNFAILELAQKGLISLGFTKEEQKTFFKTKQVTKGYIELTLKGSETLRAHSAFEDRASGVQPEFPVYETFMGKTLEYLFVQILGSFADESAEQVQELPQVGTRLYLDDMSQFAKERPREFSEHYSAWMGFVSSCVNRLDYFGRIQNKTSKLLFGLIAVLVAAGVYLVIATDGLWLLGFAYLIGAVLLFFCSLTLTVRLTAHGIETAAKAKALKAWLKDFSRIDERPCSDIAVWGEFMVYACVLNVAKEALKNIKDVAPEFVDYSQLSPEEELLVGLPWWMIYYGSAFRSSAPGAFAPEDFDFAKALDESISSSIASVQEALSDASDASGFGGSGFGSGFSMGGGGGFGGGGGGGAR